MKNNHRILIVLLILTTIMFSNMPYVSAAGTVVLTTSSVSGFRGDTVDISVSISSGSNMQACGLELQYDSKVLELVTATKGSVLSTGMTVINKNVLGKVILSYTTTETSITTSGLLLDIEFKIKADAPYGVSAIHLIPKEMLDENFSNIDVSANSGTFTVIAPVLDVPENLRVLEKNSNYVELLWDSIVDATGYNLYLNNSKINIEPILTNSFVVYGLQQNTQYQFEVTSVNFTTESAQSDAISIITDIENIVVLFVNWNYSSIDFSDDCIIDVTNVEYGGTVSAPSVPVREGYTFTGWDKPLTNITEYTVIQAQYTINTYNVVFKNYNGDTLKTQSVEYGSSASAPTVPERIGYTFTGWDVDFSNITGDLTVTAQFTINQYTVTFKNWQGNTISTQTVAYGGFATAPTAPVRDGYTFSGWDKSFGNIAADTVVTAQYVQTQIDSYTVLFVDWNGNILKTQTVQKNNSATAPASPSRTGYTFTGWDKSFSSITSDLTITAQYTINKYTVTFRGLNNSLISIVSDVDHGSTVTAPTAPTVNGYTFSGWDTSLSNITGNTVITAVYTQIDLNAPLIYVSYEHGFTGKIVNVEVSIQNNPGIISAYLNLTYDTTKLKLIKATDAGLLQDKGFGNNLSAIPYKMNWDGSLLDGNITDSGLLVTLQFEVLNTAALGFTSIQISYGTNGILNYDLQRVAFGVLNGGVEIDDYIPGDVNGDDLVDELDVAILRRYLAGWSNVTIVEGSSDVNADAVVDELDVAILRRYLAGWENINLL